MTAVIIPENQIVQGQQVLISPFSQEIANQIVVVPPVSQDYKIGSSSGRQINFNIPLSSYAIDTQKSVLEYTAQLTYHFKPKAAGKSQCAWIINGKVYQQDFDVPTGADTTTPPALVTGAGTDSRPYVVGTAPINAMNPILSTQVNAMKSYRANDYIRNKMLYYTLKAAGDSTAKNLQTYFLSNNEYNPQTAFGDYAIFFDGRPQLNGKFLGTTKWVDGTVLQQAQIDPNFSLGPQATYTTDYAVTIYKKFQIPLNLVNDIFAQTQSNLFLANAVQGESMLLQVKLMPYDTDKLFGTRYTSGNGTTVNGYEGAGFVNLVTDLTASGQFNSNMLSGNSYASYIKDMKLILVVKQGQRFTQFLRSQPYFTNKLQTYTAQPVRTFSKNDVGSQNFQLTSSEKQIQDIMQFFQINDDQALDSIKCHGLPSLYNAYDIVKMLNSRRVNLTTPFLWNYQAYINWGNNQAQQLITGDTGIKDMDRFKDITLQALRLYQTSQNSACSMFDDKQYKLFLHLLVFNTESLRNDALSDNVAGDGLDMNSAPIQLQWGGFVNYNNSLLSNAPGNIPTSSDVTSVNDMVNLCKYTISGNNMQDTSIDMNVVYIKESWSQIRPQENNIILTDDMERVVEKPTM